jgi:hypothetical protein
MDNGHATIVDDLAQKLPGVALPSKPVSSPVLFKADSTTLVVSWEAVRPNPANLTGPSGRLPPGAEEYLNPSAYRLQVSQANSSTATVIRRWTLVAADITGTTYKIRGLAPSSSYVTRVGACNAYGWGEYSDISDVMTTAPANINATNSSSSSAMNDLTSPYGDNSSKGNSIDNYNDSSKSDESSSSSSSSSSAPIMFWGNKGTAATTGNNNRDPSPNSITSPNPSDSSNRSTLLSPNGSSTDRSRSNTRKGSSVSGTTTTNNLSRTGSIRTPKTLDTDDDSDSTPTPTIKMNNNKPPLKSSSNKSSSSSSTYNDSKHDSDNEYTNATTPSSSSSSSAWAGANSAELRDVLRTLQMDLEEEQSRRRILESELGRYTAAPASLAALSVDELTSLETLLEESIKKLRTAKEKKMKEALGDEMSRTLCSVCLTKPKNMLFLPCKHLCACSECAGRIMKPLPDAKGNRKPPLCPICRVQVAEVLDVYA